MKESRVYWPCIGIGESPSIHLCQIVYIGHMMVFSHMSGTEQCLMDNVKKTPDKDQKRILSRAYCLFNKDVEPFAHYIS